MKTKRVICAMSGGVDSSVAAALLRENGYEVIGVFMKLWAESAGEVRENICCSAEAASAARAVANKLGIPFYVVNFAQEFKEKIVDYYIKEYEEGRTPNPCVICNRDIKGELLLAKAKEFEADFLASGHYVNLTESNNIYRLFEAKDSTRDQSYFLWMLNQSQLGQLLFPVGDLLKSEVRNLARKYALPTAERTESRGICFIPDKDTCGFLRRFAKKGIEPGPMLDTKGKKIGEHSGLVNYTVGQRERLGLGGPLARYVVKLESKANSLIIGDEADLNRKELLAGHFNWISGEHPDTNLSIGARIRYGHKIARCKITFEDDKARVEFAESQRAVTPGQSIVFYSLEDINDSGKEMLGGGIILE